MKRYWLKYVLLGWVVLALWPGRSSAQQAAVTWEIVGGFDGTYKIGAWFPVAITIANNGPDLRGTVSVRLRNADGITYRQTVDLPNGAKKRIVVPVISDGNESGFMRADVTLREDSTVLLSETINLNATPRFMSLIAVVSDAEGGLPSVGNFRGLGGRDAAVVRLNSAALSDRSEFLRSFDALFVYAIDPTAWTDAHRDALRRWIGDGRQLIVGGDDRVAQALADLLPATIAGAGGTSTLKGLSATGWSVSDSAGQVSLLQLAPQPNAQVLATGDAGQPLLVWQRAEAGAVLLSAFDLEALAGMGNANNFWRIMLQRIAVQDSFWSQVRDQGFMILRDSLQTPGWGFVSVVGLLGFLGVYIVMVGPINYLILRRLNRREWAYLTIPLWVLLFSVSAYLWGTVGRGSSAVVNQLTIVRVPQQSAQGQALGLISLFSPTRTTYNLEFAQNALVSDVPSFSGGQSSSFDVLSTEGSVQVPNLVIDVGGMSLLYVEQAVAAPELTAVVREVDSRQEMTVRNFSDQRLTDVLLLRGDGRVQEIDTLEPGAERTIMLQPDHFFNEQMRISDSDLIQRQVVVRLMAGFLPSVFSGDFVIDPRIVPPAPPMRAYPAPGEPIPTPAPIQIDPRLPTPTPIQAAPDVPTLAPVQAEPTVPTAAPIQAEPGVPPATMPQRDPQQTWYVLGWQTQAPIEMELGGRPAQADGETLYIWAAQKEQ